MEWGWGGGRSDWRLRRAGGRAAKTEAEGCPSGEACGLAASAGGSTASSSFTDSANIEHQLYARNRHSHPQNASRECEDRYRDR